MKPTNNKQKVPVPQPSSLSHSDTKKPFIIALISFGAIIILVLLLFLSSQFVGKAIWYDDSSLSFGIEQPSSKIYENKKRRDFKDLLALLLTCHCLLPF